MGSFTSTITLSNPILNWTNQNAAATIDRTQDLKVTWTGGNPGSYVFITGSSSIVKGTDATIVGFTCLASADTGQFTVPSYILSALPAGLGAVLLQNNIQLPLRASGLDTGIALADVSYTVDSTYK